eukprot:GHVQ01035611.1.p2 GENE.GHVQ01035611.1~~GHVQ01035611.1.p2  ORF type:complete len:101 (-),score=17.19 GHVQ01035611.1:703-1005(-)
MTQPHTHIYAHLDTGLSGDIISLQTVVMYAVYLPQECLCCVSLSLVCLFLVAVCACLWVSVCVCMWFLHIYIHIYICWSVAQSPTVYSTHTQVFISIICI